MNKLEKYLMKQIEAKDREIKAMQSAMSFFQDYERKYFEQRRLITILSQKACIKSFDMDGTIKRYIDLGDVNDYGKDKEHFAFVADQLGINKYYDPEGDEHVLEEACDCDDCSEEGGDDVE